jgi:Domain of unknown function (DUF4124)
MKHFIPVLLMLFSVSAHAELHKWVDAAGNVHYSDTAPPAGAAEQQVHIPQAPAGPTSEVPASKSIFERDADLEKALKARKEADQKAAQEQKAAETKRKNCENSRDSLRSLKDAPRIATYDANGNRVIMDDATRQQKIEETQKAVSQFCN